MIRISWMGTYLPVPDYVTLMHIGGGNEQSKTSDLRWKGFEESVDFRIWEISMSISGPKKLLILKSTLAFLGGGVGRRTFMARCQIQDNHQKNNLLT